MSTTQEGKETAGHMWSLIITANQECCQSMDLYGYFTIYYFCSYWLLLMFNSLWIMSLSLGEVTATLIITTIAAVALDLGYAVGVEPISSERTIRSPIRKGRGTKP